MNESTRAEELVLPEEAKLPFPPSGAPDPMAPLPPELREAWTEYMISGFKQNEQMFKTTLEAFMKPYRLTIWLYGILFAVGIGLFVVAAIVGLVGGNSVVAIAFGGLSVGSFLIFFVQRPLRALEENLEFITWLGVAFNSYWTRLMYLSDARTVGADLKAADDDFRAAVEKLIEKHARLRGQRPSFDTDTG